MNAPLLALPSSPVFQVGTELWQVGSGLLCINPKILTAGASVFVLAHNRAWPVSQLLPIDVGSSVAVELPSEQYKESNLFSLGRFESEQCLREKEFCFIKTSLVARASFLWMIWHYNYVHVHACLDWSDVCHFMEPFKCCVFFGSLVVVLT